LGGGGRLAGSKKVSQKPEEELPTSLSWNNFGPKNKFGSGREISQFKKGLTKA